MEATSTNQNEIRTFGPFTFDPDCGELSRNGSRLRLQPQPALVLALLTSQPGKLISREEIYRAVWGEETHVDFEQSLNYCIRQIRSALRDDPSAPKYLATVPKRGYRFLCEVKISGENGSRPGPSADAEMVSEASEEAIATKSAPTGWHQKGVWVRLAIVGGLFVILLLAAISAVWWRTDRRPYGSLHESDTVLLADFSNSTGDAVFDDTLKTALTVSLRQSPFLNILSDSQVKATLQLMTRPADAKLPPALARELCLRAGSAAYIAGAIGSLGSEYVLGLKAINCQNGGTLAQQQITAASREKVLDALGHAASSLRSELGESLATVKRFDIPLEEATTSSLEALKEYSVGIKTFNEQGASEALPYHQRAIQLDPNFALGYWAVGDDYGSLAEIGRAGEYFTKAFQLRTRASERERLTITGIYYLIVTGELDKAAQTYQDEIASYPRDAVAYGHLSVVFNQLGQYEKSAEITRQALRIAPNEEVWYENLANCLISLQRLDEARQIIREAQTRKLDNAGLRNALYDLAFLAGDPAAMAEHQQWFTGKPEESFGLALASDTEAYVGHVSRARELTKQAVDSAIRADSKENGAIWMANSAIQQAAYGERAAARQSAARALNLSPASQGVGVEAALALALAGDRARADSLVQDLEKRFSQDTQLQSLWLPAIHAQLALDRGRPSDAVNALQAASPIEFGNIIFDSNTCLYHVYVSGGVRLAAGQGAASAAEFQKILDHSGLVVNCWTGALAHLGLAQANALQARTTHGADADAARVRALAAYKDFLTLWKDADSDIPILREAKAEYARLK
jgi:DNA-binding winged helix-turn-helix (wHTH) protein/tetratricopeptide (TPR) repeat protein